METTDNNKQDIGLTPKQREEVKTIFIRSLRDAIRSLGDIPAKRSTAVGAEAKTNHLVYPVGASLDKPTPAPQS